MSLWKDDSDLFEIAKRELFTAVVGDIMDQLGLQNQFVPPQVRPLYNEMVVIGRAMTVLGADVYSGDGHANKMLSKSFGLMLEALDDLKPDEVYVAAGASPGYALWGELMSVRARHLGAVGAVMNGYSRDTHAIVSMGFPVFSYGPYAQDQAPRGKVLDFRVPIKMGSVHINPGDIIFGDIDGVCVIPHEAEKDVFTKVLEKARGEKVVRKAIENGMSAADAFRTYGIL
ncbi:MAG: RraA family protein [Chloroflexota bacterium]